MEEEEGLLNKRGDAYCACRYLECGRKFKSLKALEQHLLLYHNISWDAYTRYSPSRHHDAQENALDDPLGKRKDAYCMCTYMECGRKFKMLKNLEEHVTLYHNISWQVYTQYYHRWVWKTKDDKPVKVTKPGDVSQSVTKPHTHSTHDSPSRDQDKGSTSSGTSSSLAVSPSPASNQMVSYMSPSGAVPVGYGQYPYPIVPTVIHYQPLAAASSTLITPSTSNPYSSPQMVPVPVSPTYMSPGVGIGTFQDSTTWLLGQPPDPASLASTGESVLNLSRPKPEKVHSTTKIKKSTGPSLGDATSSSPRLCQVTSKQPQQAKSPQYQVRKESNDKEEAICEGGQFVETRYWARGDSPRMNLPDVRNGVIVIQPKGSPESLPDDKIPVNILSELPPVSQIEKYSSGSHINQETGSHIDKETQRNSAHPIFSLKSKSKEDFPLDHQRDSPIKFKLEDLTLTSHSMETSLKIQSVLDTDFGLAPGNYLGHRSLSMRGRSASAPDLQSLNVINKTLSLSVEKTGIGKRSGGLRRNRKRFRNFTRHWKELEESQRGRFRAITTEETGAESTSSKNSRVSKSKRTHCHPLWKQIYSSRAKRWFVVRYKHYCAQLIKWQYSHLPKPCNVRRQSERRLVDKPYQSEQKNKWKKAQLKHFKPLLLSNKHFLRHCMTTKRHQRVRTDRKRSLAQNANITCCKLSSKSQVNLDNGLPLESARCSSPLQVLSPEDQLQAVKSSLYLTELDPECSLVKENGTPLSHLSMPNGTPLSHLSMPKKSNFFLQTLDQCSSVNKHDKNSLGTLCVVPMLKYLAYDAITKVAPRKNCQKAWDMYVRTVMPSSGKVRQPAPLIRQQVSKAKTSIKVEVNFERKNCTRGVTDTKVAITTMTSPQVPSVAAGLQCRDCGLTLTSHREYVRHRFQYHQMMRCRVCEDEKRGSSHLYRYPATVARHLMVNHRVMAALSLPDLTYTDSYAGRDLRGIKVIENLDKVAMVTEEKIYFNNHTVITYQLSYSKSSPEGATRDVKPDTGRSQLTKQTLSSENCTTEMYSTDEGDGQVQLSPVGSPPSQSAIFLDILDIHHDVLPKKGKGRRARCYREGSFADEACRLKHPLSLGSVKKELQREGQPQGSTRRDMGVRPKGKGASCVERVLPKQDKTSQPDNIMDPGTERTVVAVATRPGQFIKEDEQEISTKSIKRSTSTHELDDDTNKLVIDEGRDVESTLDTSDTSNSSVATSDTIRFRGPKKKFLEEFRRSDSSPALENSTSDTYEKVGSSSQKKDASQHQLPMPDSNVNDEQKVCDSTKSDDAGESKEESTKSGEKVPMFNLRSCIDLIIDSRLIHDKTEILNEEYNIKVSLSRLEQHKTVRDLVKTSSKCQNLRNVLGGSLDSKWKTPPSLPPGSSKVSTSSKALIVETKSEPGVMPSTSSSSLANAAWPIDFNSPGKGTSQATIMDHDQGAVQSPLHQIAALASMLPRQPITALATEADKLGNSRETGSDKHLPHLPSATSRADSTCLDRVTSQPPPQGVASRPPALIDTVSKSAAPPLGYMAHGGSVQKRSLADCDFRSPIKPTNFDCDFRPPIKSTNFDSTQAKRSVLPSSSPQAPLLTRSYTAQPSHSGSSRSLAVNPSSFSSSSASQGSPGSVYSLNPVWMPGQQGSDQRLALRTALPSGGTYGERPLAAGSYTNQPHTRPQSSQSSPGKSPSPRGPLHAAKGQHSPASLAVSAGSNSVRYMAPSPSDTQRAMQDYQSYSHHRGTYYRATDAPSAVEGARPSYPGSQYSHRPVPQQQSVRSYSQPPEQRLQQHLTPSAALPPSWSAPQDCKPLGITAVLQASHQGTVGAVAPSATAAVSSMQSAQFRDAPLDLTTKAKPFTQHDVSRSSDARVSAGDDSPLDLTMRRPAKELVQSRSHLVSHTRPVHQSEPSGFSQHIRSLESSMQKRIQTFGQAKPGQVHTNRAPPPLLGPGHLPYLPPQASLATPVLHPQPSSTPPTSQLPAPSSRPPISQETQSTVKQMLSYPPLEKTLTVPVTRPTPSNTSSSLVNTDSKRVARGQIRMSATSQLLGNHPPDDILYLKCNVCNSTYGSLHSFRRHFFKVHGFGPTTEHVTVRSISDTRGSASKTERALVEIEKPVHAEQVQGRFLSPPVPDVLSAGHSPTPSPDVFQADQTYDMVHMQVQRPCTMGELEHKMAPLNDQSSTQSSRGEKSLSPNHKPTDVTQSMMRCLQCGQDFPTRDWGVFRRHVRAHEQPQLKCSLCRQAFGSARDLQEHNKTYHQDQMWVCRFCGVAFTHPGALGKHMKMVHEAELPQEEEYKCQLCPLVFLDMQQLLLHLGDHKDQADAAGLYADALVRGSAVRRASPDSTNDVEQKHSIESTYVVDDKKQGISLDTLKQEEKNKPEQELAQNVKQEKEGASSPESLVTETNKMEQTDSIEKVSRLPPNKTLYELITDKVEEETRKYLNAPKKTEVLTPSTHKPNSSGVHPSSTSVAANGNCLGKTQVSLETSGEMVSAQASPGLDRETSGITSAEVKTEPEVKGNILRAPFKTMRDALNLLVERAVAVDSQDGRDLTEVIVAEFRQAKYITASAEGSKGAVKDSTGEDSKSNPDENQFQRATTNEGEPVVTKPSTSQGVKSDISTLASDGNKSLPEHQTSQSADRTETEETSYQPEIVKTDTGPDQAFSRSESPATDDNPGSVVVESATETTPCSQQYPESRLCTHEPGCCVGNEGTVSDRSASPVGTQPPTHSLRDSGEPVSEPGPGDAGSGEMGPGVTGRGVTGRGVTGPGDMGVSEQPRVADLSAEKSKRRHGEDIHDSDDDVKRRKLAEPP